MQKGQTYIAFLRGINVGHHTVPMVVLRQEMEKMGFAGAETLLNSGNVIFKGDDRKESELEDQISMHLGKVFGFPIPVHLRTAGEIAQLIAAKPFRDVRVTGKTRLYVTFLKQEPGDRIPLPWISDDGSFRIIDISNRAVSGVLDLSISPSTRAMETLERIYGRDITTRNWNTLIKIVQSLQLSA